MTEKRIRNSRDEYRSALHAAQYGLKKELRDTLAILPDPHDYVYCMTDDMVEALLCAERRYSCWTLPNEGLARALRPFGLVDYSTRHLTAFGHAVWRVLTEESQ
jgi:hypothetical protein